MRERRRVFIDLDAGRWFVEQLLRVAAAHAFEVNAYCVMPDHVHALVSGRNAQSNLRTFVHALKTKTGYEYAQKHGIGLWQEGYFERKLRQDDSLRAITEYILQNPVKGGLVANAKDYTLSFPR